MNYTFLNIAQRHLLARKKQTVVAVLGVTFGIAMYILMSGFMTGVNKTLDETQFTASPHIRIYHEFKTNRKSILEEETPETETVYKIHHQKPKKEELYLKNASSILESLRKDPNLYGISAQVGSGVFYNYGPIQINGSLMGVNVMDEDRLFDLKKRLLYGKPENLLTVGNSILMGEGLAKKLSAEMGDVVTITTPKGVVFNLKVVGIFRFGLGAIDNFKCYCSIQTVQNVLQKDKSYITEIYIKVKDLEKAPALARLYEKKFGYTAEDWQTANAAFLSGNKLRGIMVYLISGTLLVVAGFGIYNIMSMTINDKIKDIAILKATGFSGKDIVGIFLTQAMIIGLMGALVGITLGFILCLGVSKIPFDGGGIISIDHLPMNFAIKYYIIGVLFGTITTAIAGFMPARKASKIDPVAIFRG
jgi:lipoprotein-releasing system permease protein